MNRPMQKLLSLLGISTAAWYKCNGFTDKIARLHYIPMLNTLLIYVTCLTVLYITGDKEAHYTLIPISRKNVVVKVKDWKDSWTIPERGCCVRDTLPNGYTVRDFRPNSATADFGGRTRRQFSACKLVDSTAGSNRISSSSKA